MMVRLTYVKVKGSLDGVALSSAATGEGGAGAA
jgi:hypothetical protein